MKNPSFLIHVIRSSAVLIASPGHGWRKTSKLHSKMGQASNQRKLFSIKAKDRLGRVHKNVLTGKRSLFGGCLAEKQGGRAFKIPLFFVCFHFLGIFSPGRR
jgi:hypothetical protein